LLPVDTWQTVSTLGTGRRFLAAASGDGSLYAVGGSYNDKLTGELVTVPAVEALSDVQGTWSQLARLATPRQDHVAAFANGHLYVIGGVVPLSATTTALAIEEYDPSAGTWQEVGTLTYELAGAAACVYNDSIYVFGGRNLADGTICDSIRVFDPRSRTWTPKGRMRAYRAFHQAVVLDSVIYIIGGQGGTTESYWDSDVLRNVETYDPRTGAHADGPAMPKSRMYFGAAAVGDAILVMGGVDCRTCAQPTVLSDVIELRPSTTNTWQTRGLMPGARFGFGIAVHKGAVYVVGGATAIPQFAPPTHTDGVARYYP
jgi:N-acetylneuraminic acid mutarotase